MFLRELSIDDGLDVYEMLQRIGPSENAFHNDVNGMSFEEFKQWLIMQHDWAEGKNLPDGYVRQWTYWLVVDDIPVGYGKLREKATEASKRFGGNIGFAIDPNARGKGYGNKLFELLLREAKEKRIKEVFSTVEKFNYASKRVHEKCGGEFINEDEYRWYFFFKIQIE